MNSKIGDCRFAQVKAISQKLDSYGYQKIGYQKISYQKISYQVTIFKLSLDAFCPY